MITLFMHCWKSRLLRQEEAIHFITATSLASIDNYIGVWKQKYEHDAVRPFTAIKYLYHGRLIKGDTKLRNGYILNSQGIQNIRQLYYPLLLTGVREI